MLGAIAGDVIGSVHEFAATKTKDFVLFDPRCSFTDDSVLAVAVADCLLHAQPYAETLLDYYGAYPDAGYGFRFHTWASTGGLKPYNSYGNGSAMRVAPVGWAFGALDQVLAEASRSAEVTHNHPEGIKGAQAIAAAIFLARQRNPKNAIRVQLEEMFGYGLRARLDAIRPGYRFDESCQLTVPAALIAFFESDDYEDAVRNAISLGGDADTLACIAGGVAEAYYGPVPRHIAEKALAALDARLRATTIEFISRYDVPMA
jgi:ADP-ribosylglycohydrolase